MLHLSKSALRIGVAFCLFVGVASAQNAAKKSTVEVQPPEVQRTLFDVPEGFAVELIAAEPAVINPITMALDEQGRIYLSEGHTYRYGPKGSPVKTPTNPIIRLDRSPDGKSWKRTVVAEGFADPVMGLLVRDGKLWCTACDHIYVYDLDENGVGVNKKEIVHDKTKAWNPFGFFVLERGPDDLIYVSVGNHNIQLTGPTNTMTSRGNSGIVMRMKPDGSDMEKLVEGLRVPYSIEFDPYGQLWLLSNGQGNPDRFVKVISGVDYMCYSRPKVGNGWLASKSPLAPPCLEITNGARTQLLHYYGAAFPESFQGWQLGVNWGPHGVGTRNHALEEFVPDERERVTKTSNWFTCRDARFRPTQLMLAPDGNLLVADWYGRDDENDLTGRIWKITYTGKDAPKTTRLADGDWNDVDKVVSVLGSLDHMQRERAVRELAKRGDAIVKQTAGHAATSAAPLGAASALWVLARVGTAEAKAAIAEGLKNPNWKVRRLALRLLRRYEVPGLDALAASAAKDADPAVRLEAALSRAKSDDRLAQILATLNGDVAADPHLRYEAASHVAKLGQAETLNGLLASKDANVRLAGLIAIDLAIYENTPLADPAREILGRLLASPGEADVALIIDLANQHPDPKMIAAVQTLLAQPNLPSAVASEGSKLLRTLAGKTLVANPWIQAIKSGKAKIVTLEDKQTILSILPSEGPTPFGLATLGDLLEDSDPKVILPAVAVAREWGPKAKDLAPAIWQRLAGKGPSGETRLELISAAAAIGSQPDPKTISTILADAPADAARQLVRELRRFPMSTPLLDVVKALEADLLKRDPDIRQDVDLTRAVLGTTAAKESAVDRNDYRDFALKNAEIKPAPTSLALGRAVFHRAGCAKCHTLTEENAIGPTLGGAGRHDIKHVVESILEPSKVILTGYEVERIETTRGTFLSGIVREKGKTLVITSADKVETLPKDQVAERTIVKLSIMPEGMEKTLSRAEVTDLVTFLMAQKANVGPPPAAKKK